MPDRTQGDPVDHLLGELEAAIMRLMWARSAGTVRDILGELRASGRLLAYTTVMTVMSRLVGKAVLRRELAGKTHVYRAAVTREEFVQNAAAAQVQALVTEFGDLAIAQFLAQVTSLSPHRRRQLERLTRGEAP